MYMIAQSRISVILVTWLTGTATMAAAWPTPGMACGCAAKAPVQYLAPAGCCCCGTDRVGGQQPCCRSGSAVQDSCHTSEPRAEAGPCRCSAPMPEPSPPVAPARPAAEFDDFGPPTLSPAIAFGSVLPPAGHRLFGPFTTQVPAPPIDLTLSLSRLTC